MIPQYLQCFEKGYDKVSELKVASVGFSEICNPVLGPSKDVIASIILITAIK